MAEQTTIAGSGVSLDEMVAESIELLREVEPDDGYYGCFSGGKDSVVIKHLAEVAGVEADWHYNNVTIDPPELTRFIRQHHADVSWEQPRLNFFRRLEQKVPPTRTMRWCCEEYKESRMPRGRVAMVGVRAAESPRRRATWEDVTWRARSRSWAVAPILRWYDSHVWGYIRREGLPYCSLYDEGFGRLGCVGCPLGGPEQQRREFARWPGYERQWRLAFRRFWERRCESGHDLKLCRFDSWQDLWAWWMREGARAPAAQCNQLDMWS